MYKIYRSAGRSHVGIGNKNIVKLLYPVTRRHCIIINVGNYITRSDSQTKVTRNSKISNWTADNTGSPLVFL